MNKFSSAHIATFAAGQPRKLDGANVTVTHDQQCRAYAIDMRDFEEFCTWVSGTWFTDDQSRAMSEEGEYTETVAEHLDRVDVLIVTVQPDVERAE